VRSAERKTTAERRRDTYTTGTGPYNSGGAQSGDLRSTHLERKKHAILPNEPTVF
jgi:hypothetical protein